MIQASKERNTDVWIKQLDRGPVSRLTFSQAVLGRPAWSPDGAEVRFLKGDTVFSVWSVRADGSGEARRLRKHALGIYELESTPDGAALILRVNSVPEGDIALARLSDTTITPLLATDFNEKSPAVSPDGRWLAYVSDESGRDEVYVRPFPRVSEGRWQVSKDGGTEPRWAHSGRELFYRMPGTDGAGSMMAEEVVTTPVFAATALRPLFADSFLTDDTHHLYAVARDDRRFLMWRPVAGEQEAPGTLVLAEHWLKGVVAGARR
jgi:serine/threonine-protein kinase